LPGLRLEFRHGSARPVAYDVGAVSYLVGTVPGCDLRLPGAALPAVCCLLTRRPDGIELRKLAPIGSLLVNGQPAGIQRLNHGDRITIGAIELHVEIAELPAQPSANRVPAVRLAPLPAAPAYSELADLRQQLYDRYRQRRDRLAGLREAIRRAARKVQERKAQVDAEARALAVRREEAAVRQAQLDSRAEEMARERTRLDDEQRQLAVRDEQLRRDVAGTLAEAQACEVKVVEERKALEKGQAEHQAALARLDRMQAALDEREKRLRGHALEVDRRFEQLQHDSRELEEQAAQLDDWRTKLTAESEALAARQREHETAAAHVAQRSVALEGQQAMLAALRTRLERVREQVRQEEEQLAGLRARHEETEADLLRRSQDVEQLRAELEAERSERAQEAQRLKERAALMESAVARLREAQESLAAREASMREREQKLDALAAEHAEQGGLLRGRSDQLRELQERLTAERQALREREAAVVQSEQSLTPLQEQLRRRADEIAARQKAQDEQRRAHEEALAAAESARAAIDAERERAQAALAVARQELDARGTELDRLREQLAHREQALAENAGQLDVAGRAVDDQRRTLAEERAHLEEVRSQSAAALERARAEFESARQAAAGLQGQVPELEARAAAATERLARARDQLREHLGELHAYAREARADLEALRAQGQAEAERVRQQVLDLHRERDEHRLAVAAFRQQLIDWQAQVADMKRSLAHGETRLERRLAEVDAQARQVDATSARLAQQAEQLQHQERLVAERRGEIEHHLEDMREWYRRKLRELTGRSDDEAAAGDVMPAGAILSLPDEPEPGDRRLGDLLRSLELVDADTLTALLAEARRQRRSLRQLLLAGGYLTLYQMALIEAGNLDGLVLGPFRLIDRLRTTPREVVYRVFDPRRGHEAVLRHLTESEMHDAVHPDEYRQRFAALAAVSHPNLAATLEVLDVFGRPAVLQEWLTGLPSSDWPALAAVPGVWHRLVCQAALGLSTLHQAGLACGGLDAGSILLNDEGTLKLCGAGEPAWLRGPPAEERDAAADVRALGQVAAGWLELADAQSGPKPKPLPEALRVVAQRLTGEEGHYTTAAELLDDLEKAGGDVPANGAAWDRLLRHIRDRTGTMRLRLSA
jgi:DNA repair exonuclease SbcCD ATPase subunit